MTYPIGPNGTLARKRLRNPDLHYAADWALQVRDAEGRTGWLHFGRTVFAAHPVGSYDS